MHHVLFSGIVFLRQSQNKNSYVFDIEWLVYNQVEVGNELTQ